MQTAEMDLTPIIESRLYLEKCIQEVDYLLQSSNIVQQGQGQGQGQEQGRGGQQEQEGSGKPGLLEQAGAPPTGTSSGNTGSGPPDLRN